MANPVETVFDATEAERIAFGSLQAQANAVEAAWGRVVAGALKAQGLEGDFEITFDPKAGKFTVKPKPVEACPIGA